MPAKQKTGAANDRVEPIVSTELLAVLLSFYIESRKCGFYFPSCTPTLLRRAGLVKPWRPVGILGRAKPYRLTKAGYSAIDAELNRQFAATILSDLPTKP